MSFSLDYLPLPLCYQYDRQGTRLKCLPTLGRQFFQYLDRAWVRVNNRLKARNSHLNQLVMKDFYIIQLQFKISGFFTNLLCNLVISAAISYTHTMDPSDAYKKSPLIIVTALVDRIGKYVKTLLFDCHLNGLLSLL